MIILLPLLRKLSIRSRTIVGSLVLVAGVICALVALIAVPALLVQGLIAVVVGAILLGSVWRDRRAGVPAGGRATIAG